jgi:hypothetical protein
MSDRESEPEDLLWFLDNAADEPPVPGDERLA